MVLAENAEKSNSASSALRRRTSRSLGTILAEELADSERPAAHGLGAALDLNVSFPDALPPRSESSRSTATVSMYSSVSRVSVVSPHTRVRETSSLQRSMMESGSVKELAATSSAASLPDLKFDVELAGEPQTSDGAELPHELRRQDGRGYVQPRENLSRVTMFRAQLRTLRVGRPVRTFKD
mmetsp:Transcript_12978/g.34964  ORF Transcript_12978/g.34964 Transcript_12978/m.34964 type:complete len:182 (-) Transcript_12978:282-827(-)|eukprot:CAMPEP_0185838060 /NCGR_PEP_ID=MMETSP1353-20130828/12458_1 /TAXON_ID=1077150 /ORGANISM="Erythrolobus australicus, Strain CCMP3124" /LENGTH=181 /DNA_ID=CAMNT_0028537071 /DNA_START=166 /DNA_END=711 /DNA_ORIENTATION=+